MKSIICFFLLSTAYTFGQFDVPLTLRNQFNGQFGYTIIGNTLNPLDSYLNSNCVMQTNSSALLNLNSNQTIVAAYLYWSGIGDGTYNPLIQLNGNNLSADFTEIGNPEPFPAFVCFGSWKNITSIVQNTGNAQYIFSGLDLNPISAPWCSTGEQFSGWAIVVVYSENTLPNVQLNIYDGFNVASQFFNNGITPLTVSNLNITNTSSAKMSYIAFRGTSNNFSVEYISLNGNTLSNAENPPNNPFNSTNSFTSSNTLWNMDIDTFNISPYINVGNTSANIIFSSDYSRFVQTLVTSIRSELPDATVAFTQVTGQNTCNNRNLTVNYTVQNTNSNGNLPANIPVSFYANNVLLSTVLTPSPIAIGGVLPLQTTVSIPLSVANTFTLRVVVDNAVAVTSTIAESNENNNEVSQSVTLLGDTLNPTFSIPNTFCQGETVPALPLISTNNIAGTWLPNVISNQNSGSYVFTPNAGQCALPFTLNVTISPLINPTFSIPNAFCQGATVPTLPLLSDNSIAGTWSPDVISNQNSGSYVFTPNAGQCSLPFTLNVTISPLINPTFSIPNAFCQGVTVPALPLLSSNNISGTWSSNAISNQNSGSYVFTPNAGQCSLPFTINITIELPDLRSETVAICEDENGDAVFPALLSTELDGGNYTFAWSENGVPILHTQASLNVFSAGNYEVVASPIVSGCAILFDFQVVPLQPISVDIVVPTTDFEANPILVVNSSGGSGSYLYSFDGLPFQNNSVFNVRNSGSIPIVVKDVNGCYTFSETVEVWNYPRFFTPNNDGFNDTWGIVSEKPIAIEIFNRYGALLQKLTNNERWNGFFNNQPLPATDYWFVIYYEDNKMFKSHFSLKR